VILLLLALREALLLWRVPPPGHPERGCCWFNICFLVAASCAKVWGAIILIQVVMHLSNSFHLRRVHAKQSSKTILFTRHRGPTLQHLALKIFVLFIESMRVNTTSHSSKMIMTKYACRFHYHLEISFLR